MKILVFDMDGTIADLYGVTNWLKSLQNNDPSPYYNANPLYDMDVLTDLLDALKSLGWKIVVTTWLAKALMLSMIRWFVKLNWHGLISIIFPMTKFTWLNMVLQKPTAHASTVDSKSLLMIMKMSVRVGHWVIPLMLVTISQKSF